jgi:CRISPR/Cas system-associated exonuclease Cas4 (RecB family)
MGSLMLIQSLFWPALSVSASVSALAHSVSSLGISMILVACILAGILLVLWANERRASRRSPKPAQVESEASKAVLKKASTTALQLPEGKIVYQDVDGLGTPLFAKKYPLSGKPDYVILSPEGAPIPVELKLSSDSQEPQRSHIIQLAVYFVILEDLYTQPPKYGLLRYAGHEFTIQNTESLKRKVLQRLAEMEQCDEGHPPPLTRQVVSKCRICPFLPICPIGQRQA